MSSDKSSTSIESSSKGTMSSSAIGEDTRKGIAAQLAATPQTGAPGTGGNSTPSNGNAGNPPVGPQGVDPAAAARARLAAIVAARNPVKPAWLTPDLEAEAHEA